MCQMWLRHQKEDRGVNVGFGNVKVIVIINSTLLPCEKNVRLVSCRGLS